MATVLRAKGTWVQSILVAPSPLQYKKETLVDGERCASRERIEPLARVFSAAGGPLWPGLQQQPRGNRAQKAGCSDACLRRTDYTKAQSCTKSPGSRLRNLPNTSGGMLYAV